MTWKTAYFASVLAVLLLLEAGCFGGGGKAQRPVDTPDVEPTAAQANGDAGTPQATATPAATATTGNQPVAATTPQATASPISEAQVDNAARVIEQVTSKPHDVFMSPDGTADLVIPKSALPDGLDPRDITVEAASTSESGVALDGKEPIAAYRLEPDGTQFTEPVVIRLRLPIGADDPLPSLYLASGKGFSRIETTSAEVDREAGVVTVSAAISHFSVAYAGGGAEITVELTPETPDPRLPAELKKVARHFLGDQQVGVPFKVLLKARPENKVWRERYGDEEYEYELREWYIKGEWSTRGPVTPAFLPGAPAFSKVTGDEFSMSLEFTCTKGGLEGVFSEISFKGRITSVISQDVLGIGVISLLPLLDDVVYDGFRLELGFSCVDAVTPAPGPSPTPTPTATPPPTPTPDPKDAYYKPYTVTISDPGRVHYFGEPFEIVAVVTMNKERRTYETEAEVRGSGPVPPYRNERTMQDWRLKGRLQGHHTLEPAGVDEAPPETAASGDSFTVRQTFTCKYLAYGVEPRITYWFYLRWTDLQTVTNLESGEAIREDEEDTEFANGSVSTREFSCRSRPAGPQQIVSTFDADLDGWQPRTAGCQAMTHRPGGGNPGGFLFVDNDDRIVCRLLAPDKFRGPGRDLSAYYGGRISFDGKMFEAVDPTWDGRHGTGGEGFNYGTVTIAGDAGNIQADLVVVPREPKPQESPWTEWQSFSVAIVAGTGGVGSGLWTDLSGKNPVTEAQIRAVLRAVSYIDINVEAIFGREMQGIDNVTLTAAPAPG